MTLDGGELIAAEGALEDLAAGSLRVLHDASFIDDPTRLMRLARYAERLGFGIDPHTAALARSVRLCDPERRRGSAASCGSPSPSRIRSRCSPTSPSSCRSRSTAR